MAMHHKRARVCGCGRIACRMMLDDGRCAIDLARERQRSFAEISLLMGFRGRQWAEVVAKRAFVAFVRNARLMGMHDLVEAFQGVRGQLFDPSAGIEAAEVDDATDEEDGRAAA